MMEWKLKTLHMCFQQFALKFATCSGIAFQNWLNTFGGVLRLFETLYTQAGIILGMGVGN